MDGCASIFIIENPYGYDPLNSEIMRVLQKDGTIEITGSSANKFFNDIPTKASQLGFQLTETRIPNIGQFTNSQGVIIPFDRTPEFTKYILQLQ